MSFPVKIALGVLGGGTVAVAGHEVFAVVTGKKGLIFGESQEHRIKEEIKELLETLKPGCEIKVKSSSPEKDIDVDKETNLESLLASLKGIDQGCKTSSDTKKKILLQQSGKNNDWSVYTTIDQQIQSLIKDSNFGCEVKIRTGIDTSNQNVDTLTAEEDKESLLAKLKTLKEGDCSGSKTPKKKIVLKKETTGNDKWSLVSEQTQIKELLAKDTFKCGIKIKVSDKLKTIDSASEQELSGLLIQLEALETNGCTGTSKIHKVFENKQSGGWAEIEDEKTKVNAWIASKDKFSGSTQTCELKLFSSDWNYKTIPIGEDITGLYNFLETVTTGSVSAVESDCTTGTAESKQEIVLKKDSSSVWSVMSEGDQIRESLKDGSNFKCTVKIKNNDGDSGTQLSSSSQDNDVKNLLKHLKKEISNCSSAKELVFKKKDGNDWEKTS